MLALGNLSFSKTTWTDLALLQIPDLASLKMLKVSELKDLCTLSGIKKVGNKADLIEALDTARKPLHNNAAAGEKTPFSGLLPLLDNLHTCSPLNYSTFAELPSDAWGGAVNLSCRNLWCNRDLHELLSNLLYSGHPDVNSQQCKNSPGANRSAVVTPQHPKKQSGVSLFAKYAKVILTPQALRARSPRPLPASMRPVQRPLASLFSLHDLGKEPG